MEVICIENILDAIRDRYEDRKDLRDIIYRTKEELYGDSYSEVWNQDTQFRSW